MPALHLEPENVLRRRVLSYLTPDASVQKTVCLLHTPMRVSTLQKLRKTPNSYENPLGLQHHWVILHRSDEANS